MKMIDIAKEEFQRGYYRKLGEKFCEMAEDGPNLLMMLNVLQEIDRSSDDDAAKKIFMNMSENFKHNKK